MSENPLTFLQKDEQLLKDLTRASEQAHGHCVQIHHPWTSDAFRELLGRFSDLSATAIHMCIRDFADFRSFHRDVLGPPPDGQSDIKKWVMGTILDIPIQVHHLKAGWVPNTTFLVFRSTSSDNEIVVRVDLQVS